MKLTLAIDTSCDETSAAVVCGLEVWSNVVASQVELHKPYGGVFPTIAKQAHKENITPTVELALKRAGVKIDDVDEVAVTVGPGLAPALEVGIDYAKKLSRQYSLPIRPVNHMEGHVLSVLAFPEKKQKRPSLSIRRQEARKRSQKKLAEVKLPALAVLVSGGHTEFILIKNLKLKIKNERHPKPARRHPEFILGLSRRSRESRITNLRDSETSVLRSDVQNDSEFPDRKPRLSIDQFNSSAFSYTKLGQTLDDAAGEALDKIGRMLGLGYPAGPVIEEFAKHGNPHKYKMPLPMTTSKDYNLSFSGLKTHTRNLIENTLKEAGHKSLKKQEIYDLSASVQYGVFRHILYKLSKILADYPEINEIWLGGGVAANITLRKMIRKTISSHFSLPTSHCTFRVPYSKRLCGDNAAMVGVTC